MPITRKIVAGKLAAYLHHEISLHALVDWAQSAMMEDEFERISHDAIRDTVARLGLADVRTFELSWEDCETILKRLGYDIRIEIVAARKDNNEKSGASGNCLNRLREDRA
jgi:hypothetical protein